MISNVPGAVPAFPDWKDPRKIISQKLAYYGKKHGKKYAVRKVPGGIKVWRME